MKKTKYILNLLFTVILIYNTGCRKTDSIQPMSYGQLIDKVAVERFLSLPDNAGNDLKKIVADIKKNETLKPFLTAVIAENGMPNWQYTISPRTLFTPLNSMKSESSREGAPIYFIPMIDPNTKAIKSFLYCAKIGDSSYKYIVFNKNLILRQNPNSLSSLFNGNVILGV